MLRVLDLFSGIGGFSLGLERTGGFKTVAFCEIDPYCRAVLAKHWPGVQCFKDVRACAGVACDVICGGFPCQDISYAGKGAGLAGERSGLWGEYYRLICDLRPSYAIVENVAALLDRGLGRVLGDLAEVGYSAEWHCILASSIGAPHDRDRVWIIAYPDSLGREPSLQLARRVRETRQPRFWESFRTTDFTLRVQELAAFCRIADGLSARLDGRFHALGNAVVPQIPEIIGRAILEAEAQRMTDKCARVEHIGLATLYLGDCLEIMPTLPPMKAVITDPPYGIGIAANPVRQKHDRQAWDDAPASQDAIRAILASAPIQIIWGGNYFGLPASQGFLVWDKVQPEDFTLSMCEYAWTNLQQPAKLFRRHVASYQKWHPTQKPVELMRWCMERAGMPDVVLDPMMGAGTTGVACVELGKQFYGIEIHKPYFEIACERITNAQRQERLFA